MGKGEVHFYQDWPSYLCCYSVVHLIQILIIQIFANSKFSRLNIFNSKGKT